MTKVGQAQSHIGAAGALDSAGAGAGVVVGASSILAPVAGGEGNVLAGGGGGGFS